MKQGWITQGKIDQLLMVGDAVSRLMLARKLIDQSWMEIIKGSTKGRARLVNDIRKPLNQLIDVGVNKKISLSKSILENGE